MAAGLLANAAAASAGEPAAPPAAAAGGSRATVSLAIALDDAFSAAVTRAAVREAAAIWRPQGLRIETAGSGPCSPEARNQPCLNVVPGTETIERPWNQHALAAVRFGPDGNPWPRVEVFVPAVHAIVDAAVWLGLPPDRWPRPWTEQIYGRVLGRVLAHEIGHYMLGLREHDRYGLMAAVHQARDFVDPSRLPFTVSREHARRLVSPID